MLRGRRGPGEWVDKETVDCLMVFSVRWTCSCIQVAMRQMKLESHLSIPSIAEIRLQAFANCFVPFLLLGPLTPAATFL